MARRGFASGGVLNQTTQEMTIQDGYVQVTTIYKNEAQLQQAQRYEGSVMAIWGCSRVRAWYLPFPSRALGLHFSKHEAHRDQRAKKPLGGVLDR